MRRGLKDRGLVILGFALAVVLLSGAVWRSGYLQALDQLSQRAASDLALAGDRLTGQLQRYQELSVLLADHPDVAALASGGPPEAVQALFLSAADKTAALDLMFAGPDGKVRAAAHGRGAPDVSATAYFARAMTGALGAVHGTKQPIDRRAYYYAAPVFGADARVSGTVIVAVDLEKLEDDWRGSTPTVFFTDDAGRVFVSNRSELLFWSRSPGRAGLQPPEGPDREFARRTFGGHDLWRLGWGPYVPDRALHLVRPLPVIGLTGEVLVDTRPALRLAGLQAAAVAALCLAFGAILFLVTERRRALVEANAILESRVSERTRALSATNVRLRREVSERLEAEAALKRAQDDLVQAGKLSALGQMSAGISHELNQPLMAIQSFADNGSAFLRRDNPDRAAENLGRISDMARRMGRIIRNLRAFARQESETTATVDLVAAIQSAVELSLPRCTRDSVALHWSPPPDPVPVLGGEVRLSQVLVNLINNAADAMAEQSDPRDITISLRDTPDSVVVEVADTGPGIDAPEKIFDPFYTTKAVGAAEGMGLGLSISYGLVQSFGGAIRGRNRPEGGAVFTVELARPGQAEAA